MPKNVKTNFGQNPANFGHFPPYSFVFGHFPSNFFGHFPAKKFGHLPARHFGQNHVIHTYPHHAFVFEGQLLDFVINGPSYCTSIERGQSLFCLLLRCLLAVQRLPSADIISFLLFSNAYFASRFTHVFD